MPAVLMDAPMPRLSTPDRTTVIRTAKHKTIVVRTTNQPKKWRIFMDILTLPVPSHSATPKAKATTVACGSLVALDLGTNTGWALRGRGDFISSGTVSFKPSRSIAMQVPLKQFITKRFAAM
jgi:hypothetical protein